MRKRVLISVVFGLLLQVTYAQTPSPSILGLKPEQVPSDCKVVDGDFPIDIQTAILWKNTDIYKSIMQPVTKNAQSFECQGAKGTVYVFQFSSANARERAAAFVKPLLWGESQPTAEHPELVLEGSDTLTVVSFRKPPASLVTSLQASANSSTTRANKSQVADFEISGHGRLHLEVPDAWQVKAKQTSDPPSVTLHFTPTAGDAFDVQVTSVWLDSERLSKMTAASVRASVQRTGEGLLAHAVEKAVELHDLSGAQTFGCYYSLTDSAPGPGEFTILTQGNFITGEILSAFTILYRTPASPDAAQALRSFTEATYGK